MSSQQGIVINGANKNSDLHPDIIKNPGALPSIVRRKTFYRDNIAFFILVSSFLTIIPLIYITASFEVFFLMGLGCYFLALKNRIQYPMETPCFEYQENSKKLGKGVILIGRDYELNVNIFASDSQCRAHMLVMGTTGSGKTRFLMSILYQSMVMGSGCMYVDGKADNTVYWLVFSLCLRLDRIEDFRLINYLTTNNTRLENDNAMVRGNKEILTNTMNPYNDGDSESLRSMTVGLMRDAGGDGAMWKGRASALLSGVLSLLTYLRDNGYIELSVTSLRDAMNLDNILRVVHGSYRDTSIVNLAGNAVDLSKIDVPEYAKRALHKYLLELPSFSDKIFEENEVPEECNKQHSFLTMQMTEALADLSETYGHIFNTPIGEVNFQDLILSRRILFVMLPALQRDLDALSNLGKLIVASIRSALAPTLGSQVEGTKEEVIDSKPTNSEVPYFIILDEYGYYSVRGFAVVAAQARSLGVSVIFAGQDYAGFKNASPEEAESIMANTNIKIAMKLGEETTTDIFVKRGAKRFVTSSEGVERQDGEITSKFVNSKQVSYKEVDVINSLDIYKQKAGEAHVIVDDQVSRVQLFSLLIQGEGNGTALEAKYTRLNKFVISQRTNPLDLQKMKQNKIKIAKSLEKNNDFSYKKFVNLNIMVEQLRLQLDSNETDMKMASISSIGSVVTDQYQSSEKKESFEKVVSISKSNNDAISNNEDKMIDTTSINGKPVDKSLSTEASTRTSLFESVINEALSQEGELPIRDQLKNVAADILGDEHEAEIDANNALKRIEDNFNDYPQPPIAESQHKSKVKDKLESLDSKLTDYDFSANSKIEDDDSDEEDSNNEDFLDYL